MPVARFAAGNRHVLGGMTVVAGASEGLVTVVVPARNEESSIRSCLDSILHQEWSHLEVIVV
ncbi:MAG: glycosyltransferase, partial [Actinomycetia bacterium]|nr:glycosyltransferase [Actinomycetes bacterium]